MLFMLGSALSASRSVGEQESTQAGLGSTSLNVLRNRVQVGETLRHSAYVRIVCLISHVRLFRLSASLN